MKKFLGLVLAVSFGGSLLAGCGDPCEKAFEKWKKCMKEQGMPEKLIKKMDKKKDDFMKECKKKKDKIKPCLKKDSCKEFDRCMEKAM